MIDVRAGLVVFELITSNNKIEIRLFKPDGFQIDGSLHPCSTGGKGKLESCFAGICDEPMHPRHGTTIDSILLIELEQRILGYLKVYLKAIFLSHPAQVALIPCPNEGNEVLRLYLDSQTFQVGHRCMQNHRFRINENTIHIKQNTFDHGCSLLTV
ncbi:hypothetical protein SDC9_117948 [bioreactor metagenome]|uniref:Uncharacterized protein n=1 Tax=bioreactor metagenome TaxID=1076179 RepID=A0A645C0C8_9ZZZZ